MNRDLSSLPGECQRYLEALDGEAAGEGWREHAAACEACARETEVREKTMSRIRRAHTSAALPPGLETRIRAVVEDRRRVPAGRARWLAVAAAMVLVAGGAGTVAYVRYAEDAYIAAISSRLAAILQPGLKDHVHCTIYRGYPKTPPRVEELAADLGPAYRELAGVVRQQAPPGYAVVLGHVCQHEGRRFVHLALKKDGGPLLSLLIARKRAGESFEAERLTAAVNQDGRAFFEARAERFAISAFETAGYVVYTVSDLRPEENLRMLVAMAPQVSAVLARAGS